MKTTIMQVIVVAALSFSGAAPAAVEAGGKVPAPAASAVPPAPKGEAAPPAQEIQPAAKPPAPAKGKPRPKNLDLRHCLELEADAAIAKCAGE